MRDVDGTVQHARRALTLVPEDDQLYRGAAAALLGLASWTNGDLDAAYRFYIEGMASLRQAGYVPDTIGGMVAPTDIRITQGRLHDAMRIYQQRLRLVEELGDPTMRGTADMYVGMSEIHREWNDLETAVRLLAKSVELGEFSGFPQYPYRWRVTMARIRFAQGDPETALALLDEAAARYVSDMLPNVRPIAALKARVWISQGRLREALAWADEQGLSAGDELSYLREYEHITLARLLLAQQAGSAGDDTERGMMAFLKRLLDAAETGGRAGSVIEILALQALGHQMEGNAPAALAALERALELAEPEGYVRIFVDEEEPMRRLLQAATERGIGGGYARRLRQAFGAPSQPAPAPVPVSAASLPEPLTPREIEILRLIAAGLRNQEIADRLFISLPTVKRHVANAYGKLGATHRTEAIARANGLHLL
jgi:LuxR family maltose regulon positive regulatory protein